jgi:hypothetical protein
MYSVKCAMQPAVDSNGFFSVVVQNFPGEVCQRLRILRHSVIRPCRVMQVGDLQLNQHTIITPANPEDSLTSLDFSSDVTFRDRTTKSAKISSAVF